MCLAPSHKEQEGKAEARCDNVISFYVYSVVSVLRFKCEAEAMRRYHLLFIAGLQVVKPDNKHWWQISHPYQ